MLILNNLYRCMGVSIAAIDNIEKEKNCNEKNNTFVCIGCVLCVLLLPFIRNFCFNKFLFFGAVTGVNNNTCAFVVRLLIRENFFIDGSKSQ